MHRLARASLVLASALGGCASYVNIPPDSGSDIAISAIDAPPTPRLISASLDYVIREFPPPSRPYGVRLPVEAAESTWQKVVSGRDGAQPWQELPQDGPVYDVRSIRIRGRDAWVDITVPHTIDNRPVVELRLQGTLGGWTVTSVRRWSAGVIRPRESTESTAPPAAPPHPQAASSAIALRPLVAGSAVRETPAAPEQPEMIETAEEVRAPPSAPGQRPLTPLRPVKSGGR